MGEDEPRPVASGLREFYTLDELRGRRVLVVCNLKPAKLAGFKSHAMLLCAASDDGSRVEFVEPPADAPVGARVCLPGADCEANPAASPNQVKKRKVWESVVPHLRTDESGIATFAGAPLECDGAPCTVPSLFASRIS